MGLIQYITLRDYTFNSGGVKVPQHLLEKFGKETGISFIEYDIGELYNFYTLHKLILEFVWQEGDDNCVPIILSKKSLEIIEKELKERLENNRVDTEDCDFKNQARKFLSIIQKFYELYDEDICYQFIYKANY